MDMETARQFIEQYGYLAVFISTVIEGEVVVLAAAALASSGLLQAHLVIGASAAGAFVGHILFFAIGRWKGMQLIEAFPMLRRHYPKANVLMDKYANWSVFICQYLYGMRIISAILFGCSTITMARFFLLQVVNCIIWSIFAYFAGHLIGVVAVRLFEMLGLYGLLLVTASMATIALLLYHRFGHSHVLAFLSSGRKVGAEQTNPVEGRHFILEQLDYHMGLSARSGQPLTLLMVKLSASKSKAHAKTLKFIAHELNKLLRLSDIPARFSQGTYAIVAPSTDHDGAQQAVERLMTRISSDLPDHMELPKVSIGYTQWEENIAAGKLLDQTYRNLVPLVSVP